MNRIRSFFSDRPWLSNILQTVLIFVLTALLAMGMRYYGIAMDDMKLLYLLAILIVILQTESFVLTLLSTAGFVLLDARFMLRAEDYSTRQYVVSTIIFVVIALIVNVLSIRLQKQVEASHQSELTQKHLYEASKGLIKIRSSSDIVAYTEKSLSRLANAESHVYFNISRDDPDEAKKWCLRNSAVCGAGELDFTDSPNKYLPIRNNRKTNGVAVIDCSEHELSPGTMDSIAAFLTQISFAMERNVLEERQKKENAIYAREKIKGTVMRDLSNNMYPHIKSIEDMARELSENTELSEDERQKIFRKISDESAFLSDTVDNAIEITNSK